MKNTIKFLFLFLTISGFISCATPGEGCYVFGSVDDLKIEHNEASIEFISINGQQTIDENVKCD